LALNQRDQARERNTHEAEFKKISGRKMFRKGFIPLLGRVAGSVSERTYQRSEIREAYQPQDRGFGDS